MRLRRLSNQAHSCFFRRAATFLVVAAETGGDDIVPAFLAASGDRDDVVERQVFRGMLLCAVLTRIVIPRVNIGPRKLYLVVVLHPHVLQQADDRRQTDRESNRVNLFVVLFDDLDFASEKEGQRLLPRNDPKWFIRSVEEERCLHITS